jgi:hypothetical protein
VRDRIRQKRATNFQMKRRTLAEVLDPQPVCSNVIKRLLDWIDRVDLASQSGDDRPPFTTIDGGEIFPEDDPYWYLTEVQRNAEEQSKGDEDGPPSDEEDVVEEPNEEETDDDPLSEVEADVDKKRGHAPDVGWRKRQRRDEELSSSSSTQQPVLPLAGGAMETQRAE